MDSDVVQHLKTLQIYKEIEEKVCGIGFVSVSEHYCRDFDDDRDIYTLFVRENLLPRSLCVAHYYREWFYIAFHSAREIFYLESIKLTSPPNRYFVTTHIFYKCSSMVTVAATLKEVIKDMHEAEEYFNISALKAGGVTEKDILTICNI